MRKKWICYGRKERREREEGKEGDRRREIRRGGGG
jgi:hypothetical protein